MEELLNSVVEKTGLPVDKAQGAIDAVMGFMKEKLPEPIVSQIESFLAGGGDAVGGITDKLGDMASGAGDMLGGILGKKD